MGSVAVLAFPECAPPVQIADVFLQAERTMPAAVAALMGARGPTLGRVAILPA